MVAVGREKGKGGAVAYAGEQTHHDGGAVVGLAVREERGQLLGSVQTVRTWAGNASMMRPSALVRMSGVPMAAYWN